MSSDRELNRLRVKGELSDVVNVAPAAAPSGSNPLVNTYTAVVAETLANQLDQRTLVVQFNTNDAGTLTNGVEVPLGSLPFASRIISASFVCPVAVTANDTNYATITVSKYTAAGATKTTLASQTTKITGGSGNVTAFAANALTLSSTTADLEVVASGVLTVTILKTAAGIKLTGDMDPADSTTVGAPALMSVLVRYQEVGTTA